MPSKQELAKSYAVRLIENEFSRQTVESIISEIRNLKYEASENTISLSDKIEIVNGIKKQLSSEDIRKKIRPNSSGGKLNEQRSNDNFLDLVDFVLDQVKK